MSAICMCTYTMSAAAVCTHMYIPVLQAKKPPPRVIPYRLHQEGKKRLAESLLRQHQRTSGGSLQDQSGMMHMLTPPDTPRSTLLSNDLLEKASLDSRGSTEASASMSSGEVATGTLIDLTLLRGAVAYSHLFF